MEPKKKSELPKWLDELQQKSWEPEILLSGIVLYGMFQVPPLLSKFLMFFKSNIFGQSTDLDNMIAILNVGIYWLIGGLILHLVSRGVWVGLVGLSYTFPDGILVEKTKFKGRFRTRVEKLSTIQRGIIQLEKVSSSLFSLSFMLFMSLLGGYLYLFFLIILPFLIMLGVFQIEFNSSAAVTFQYYVIPILIIGIIGVFDFITLGLLKRIKWLEKIYWPIHKLISILTLSRFYTNVYYAFATNTNRWLFGILLFMFFLTSIFGATSSAFGRYQWDALSRLKLWDSRTQGSIFPGHYDDSNVDIYSRAASIQSDIISGNTIKLFVVADIDAEDSIRSYTNYDSLVEANPDLHKSDIGLMSINKFYHVYIDDSLIEGLTFHNYYKMQTQQRGYLAYLDITDLEVGLHTLKVSPPFKQFGKRSLAFIRFYREKMESLYTLPTQPVKEEKSVQSIKPLITN